MACWWWGREAPFLPQNLSPAKVAAAHLPRCVQPVEEGLRANGGASFSFRNACCRLRSVRGELCALPTHSGSSMVCIDSCCQSEVHVAALHHERRQYCSSTKFDFAEAESPFNKSEIIFKIVASRNGAETRPGFVYFNDLLPPKHSLLAVWGRALLPRLSNKLNVSVGYKCGVQSWCNRRMCFEACVKAGSGAAALPLAQCLAVLAQFCVRAISLHVFPS